MFFIVRIISFISNLWLTMYRIVGKDDFELEGNLVFAKSHGAPGTGMPEEFDIYYFKDGVVKE